MGRIHELESMISHDEAKEYDYAEKKFLYWIDDSFVDSILNLRNHGKLLDIGTGTALIPIKLAKKTPAFEIHAVDTSDAMLDIARKNAKEEGVEEKIKFYKNNAENLPFPDNFFDLVVSHSALHHIQDSVRFLNEADRVVKKDGIIFIRDLRRPPSIFIEFYVNVLGAQYKKIVKDMYRASLKSAYTPFELESLIRKTSITDAEIRKYFITHVGIKKDYKRHEKESFTINDFLINKLKKFYTEKS